MTSRAPRADLLMDFLDTQQDGWLLLRDGAGYVRDFGDALDRFFKARQPEIWCYPKIKYASISVGVNFITDVPAVYGQLVVLLHPHLQRKSGYFDGIHIGRLSFTAGPFLIEDALRLMPEVVAICRSGEEHPDAQ